MLRGRVKYLNIKLDILTSEEYLGCEPLDRATWLNLMSYCARQETGGVVSNAKSWGDRKWMQLCGVTIAEINRECPLWQWIDNDLSVNFYPIEQEAVAQKLRASGKLYGKGHPKDKQSPPKRQPVSPPNRGGLGNPKDNYKYNNNYNNNPKDKDNYKAPEPTPKKAIIYPSLPEVLTYFIDCARHEFININTEAVETEAKLYHSIRTGEKWVKANKKRVKNWKLDVRQWILSKRSKLIDYDRKKSTRLLPSNDTAAFIEGGKTW